MPYYFQNFHFTKRMHYGGEELEMKLTGTPYQEKSEILAMDGLWRFSLIASEMSARIPIQIGFMTNTTSSTSRSAYAHLQIPRSLFIYAETKQTHKSLIRCYKIAGKRSSPIHAKPHSFPCIKTLGSLHGVQI
ncbi:uncharacterized protein [Malus domestica]|uniref:uncharacterized protein isoform X2 n=1 Tax=Malus domestica TaxID=3750 RepID=UPI0039767559